MGRAMRDKGLLIVNNFVMLHGDNVAIAAAANRLSFCRHSVDHAETRRRTFLGRGGSRRERYNFTGTTVLQEAPSCKHEQTSPLHVLHPQFHSNLHLLNWEKWFYYVNKTHTVSYFIRRRPKDVFKTYGCPSNVLWKFPKKSVLCGCDWCVCFDEIKQNF